MAGNAATNGAEIYSLGPGPTYSGGNVIGVGALTLTDIFAAVDPVTGGGLLQDNGGLVETVALAAAVTNPAIDAGDDTLAGVPGTDARGPGFDRVDIAGVANNGANISDLGAFEVQGIPESELRGHHGGRRGRQFDNLTSLREALAYADSLAGADTITFDDSLDTVQLDGAALVIASDVTIDGDVAGDFDITIDALDNSRVFDVTAGNARRQWRAGRDRRAQGRSTPTRRSMAAMTTSPAGDADARGFARAEVPGAAHNGTNISDLGAFELRAVRGSEPDRHHRGRRGRHHRRAHLAARGAGLRRQQSGRGHHHVRRLVLYRPGRRQRPRHREQRHDRRRYRR